MNLLSPGWQSALVLNDTFTLVSWLRCPYKLTSHLNQTGKVTPFLTRLLTVSSRVLSLSLLTLINRPKLDVSFDEADAMFSSVSSGFQCSVNTVSNASSLQLASGIKSKLINYGARIELFLCVCSSQVKCQLLS